MNLDIPGIMEPFLLVFHISGKTLLGLLPYILAGTILGEIIKNSSWLEKLNHWCQHAGLLSILVAAGLGVISPLCTYGTVPLVLVLARKGFPLGPLITFMISSSSLNPQLFFVTWGGISTEMALVRLCTVILFSMMAGMLLKIIPGNSILATERIQGNQPGELQTGPPSTKPGLKSSLCNIWNELKYVGWYLIIGCVLGAVIEVFVPGDWFSGLFKSRPLGSILIFAILGVPVYVCGGGAIPLVNSLLTKGLDAGAALAFLTVGQSVRITPLLALAALIRVKYITIYVVAVMLYGILIGLIYSTT
jgi:uncharacterized membrane protein YraQ (UPF0718 family)